MSSCRPLAPGADCSVRRTSSLAARDEMHGYRRSRTTTKRKKKKEKKETKNKKEKKRKERQETAAEHEGDGTIPGGRHGTSSGESR